MINRPQLILRLLATPSPADATPKGFSARDQRSRSASPGCKFNWGPRFGDPLPLRHNPPRCGWDMILRSTRVSGVEHGNPGNLIFSERELAESRHPFWLLHAFCHTLGAKETIRCPQERRPKDNPWFAGFPNRCSASRWAGPLFGALCPLTPVEVNEIICSRWRLRDEEVYMTAAAILLK